jgi:processive 1,2-diacylglycerol beta-glucosyltransferase
MGAKKVLLLHISNVSGHCRASFAIEQALKEVDRGVQILRVNAFGYLNPYLERIINRMYMFTIQSLPQLWDYLYDNEAVFKRFRALRRIIHKSNEKKIRRLLESFKPDIIVCTQAFPCGIIADYKQRHNLKTPLIGVLTDYAPHLYWINKSVDLYVVPALKIQQSFMQKGISNSRLRNLGIPVDTKFSSFGRQEEILRRWKLNPNLPRILIMGGAQGLGPIKSAILTLNKLDLPAHLVVVCGTNKHLYDWLNKNKALFLKPLLAIGYTEEISDLMSISSFIISKPGGITSAEALSKSLPIIILKPLPGQENLNSKFLLEAGAALKANDFKELLSLANDLLSDATKLEQLRKNAVAIAHKDSSLKTARLILNMADNKNDAVSSF